MNKGFLPDKISKSILALSGVDLKRFPILLVAAALVVLVCGVDRISSATALTTTLHVEGMTCADCVPTVKRVALQIAGVISATVSYEKSSAVVSYDPAKTNPDAIARAIATTLGYKVTVALPGKTQSRVAPAAAKKTCPAPPPGAAP